jgi:hypothetical protein
MFRQFIFNVMKESFRATTVILLAETLNHYTDNLIHRITAPSQEEKTKGPKGPQ